MIPRAAYAALATLLAPALRLMLLIRARRGKEVAARLAERRGIDTTPRPPGRLVWLHAASVGETMSVLPVLDSLARARADLSVLMTTGTVTSAALLAARLPRMGLEGRVPHRFVPLDVPAWASRFLDHWRPDAVGFVESEIWPNLLAACAARRIPMMLVNARLSPRSFRRWRRLPGLAAALFGAFARVQAQSAGDAERLRAVGARAVEAPGNLKFAAAPLDADPAELARLRAVLGGRPAWLAASTHPGEEPIVLAADAALRPRFADLLTIVAPRHPARGPDIAAAAALAGLRVTRRAAGGDPPAGGGVWVMDTIGELGLLYRSVGAAFIGGSLVRHGGQNPLEAARLGCPVAAGPHTWNFAEAVAALDGAGAIGHVTGASSLADWVAAVLADPARRAELAARGMAAAERDAGLPDRVADMLLALAERQP